MQVNNNINYRTKETGLSNVIRSYALPVVQTSDISVTEKQQVIELQTV